MPTEVETKPPGGESTEPDPSPSPQSEKLSVPSSQQSPDDERKTKPEGSLPESQQQSPDEKDGAEPQSIESDSGKVPGDFRISGLTITPAYRCDYEYSSSDEEDLSDDDDASTEENFEYDPDWIDNYSDPQLNSHYCAMRDACELILEKTRLVVANYEFLKRKRKTVFDPSKLQSIYSHLILHSKDLEDLVVATTPEEVKIYNDDPVDDLLSLIQGLADGRFTRAAIEGKVNGQTLLSNYFGYRVLYKQTLKKAQTCMQRAYQCLNLSHQYSSMFVGFYKETRVLEEARWQWKKVPMSLDDMKVWNEKLRRLCMVAKKLMAYIMVIDGNLINNFTYYIAHKRDLRKQRSAFLKLGVPNVLSQEITAVQNGCSS